MTTGPNWPDQARRLIDALTGSAEQPADAGQRTAGECRWCPHCQGLAVLRGERPELTAVLGDVLATAAAALRQFAGEAPPAADGDERDGDPGPPGHRPPPVQRIEIA